MWISIEKDLRSKLSKMVDKKLMFDLSKRSNVDQFGSHFDLKTLEK